MNELLFIILVSLAVNAGMAVSLRRIAQERSNEERKVKLLVKGLTATLDVIHQRNVVTATLESEADMTQPYMGE